MTVSMEDLKKLGRGLNNRSNGPGSLQPSMLGSRKSLNLLNPSAPSFSPPSQQISSTAKFLGLTPEEADKLRDEGKCFKCKKSGHTARKCDEIAENVPASWETEVDLFVEVPDVAKPFYLR